MKNLRSILLLGALGVASIFTACDNMEDDVPPANSSNIIVNHDYYSTTKNQGVVFNVLTNDSIGSNASITFGQPAHGTVQVGNTPGTASYQPQNNFIGIDTFSYQACISGDCASAKVFVEVNSIATAGCFLIATKDSNSVKQNQTSYLNVLHNDLQCQGTSGFGHPIITRPPAHGMATFNPNGQLVYTPNHNYIGGDNLEYKLINPNGSSNTTVVMIDVTTNSYGCPSPRAISDYVTLPHTQSLDSVSINLFANDVWCSIGGIPKIELGSQQRFMQTTYGNVTIVGSGLNERLLYKTSTNAHNVTDSLFYMIRNSYSYDHGFISIYIK